MTFVMRSLFDGQSGKSNVWRIADNEIELLFRRLEKISVAKFDLLVVVCMLRKLAWLKARNWTPTGRFSPMVARRAGARGGSAGTLDGPRCPTMHGTGAAPARLA